MIGMSSPASSPGQPLPSHRSYDPPSPSNAATCKPSCFAQQARQLRVLHDHAVEVAEPTQGELEPGPDPVKRRVARTEPPHRRHAPLHAALLVFVLVRLECDVVAEPLRLLVRVRMTSNVDEKRGVVHADTPRLRPNPRTPPIAARSDTAAARAPSADRTRDRSQGKARRPTRRVAARTSPRTSAVALTGS